MLEILAFVLFLLWALGSLTGLVFGGVIHFLLPVAALVFLAQRRVKVRAASRSAVSPAGILSIVMKRGGENGPGGAQSASSANPPLLSSRSEPSPPARIDA